MSEQTSSGGLNEYIGHHLSHNITEVMGRQFHFDSWIVALVLGLVFVFWFGLYARKASAGVPSKGQAFVEMVLEFIDGQVKDTFNGDRRSVTPLALTIFMWVVFMNAMDLLPVDLPGILIQAIAGKEAAQHIAFRIVPTADLNTTAALSVSVFFILIAHGLAAKGLGGFTRDFATAPFHAHGVGAFILAPVNIVMNIIEWAVKPLSLAMRLFGNMYGGELVFMLIAGLLANWYAFLPGVIANAAWGIFHILIVLLQAFIFMILTVVYIAGARESH
ncbi:MAG: F0F1 ATP synthase subunit A [Xanthomonadaceae bacterium]|nr:F0F1 ATP synthase subunit A [Xanthomonadaceae bacterium]